MTKLSKALLVFVVFSSVAFMGFSMAARWGGPNWPQKAAELDEFAFEQANPQAPWSVKSRGLKGEDVGSGKILPEAIRAALKKKAADQQAEAQQLDEFLQAMQARLTEAKRLIELDIAAMRLRAESLEQQLQGVVDTTLQVNEQVVAKTKEGQANYDVAKLRRQEWLLMKNQLEELRAQAATAAAEKERLRDLLFQAQGNLERVRRRQVLLESDGAKAKYD